MELDTSGLFLPQPNDAGVVLEYLGFVLRQKVRRIEQKT